MIPVVLKMLSGTHLWTFEYHPQIFESLKVMKCGTSEKLFRARKQSSTLRFPRSMTTATRW